MLENKGCCHVIADLMPDDYEHLREFFALFSKIKIYKILHGVFLYLLNFC